MGAAVAPAAEMVPPTTGAAAGGGFGASFGGCEGGGVLARSVPVPIVFLL